MIRVTIELLPHGDESQARHLGTIFISNDDTGTDDWGSYNVRLTKPSGTGWRIGRVEHFPRRILSAHDLLFRALKNTVGERNE